MKKNVLLLVAMALLIGVSCKKEKNVNAKVVRDCTGIYLNIGGSDYVVCNVELILHKKDGDAVSVTYKPSKFECTGSVPTCTTKHETAGWIVIEKIN